MICVLNFENAYPIDSLRQSNGDTCWRTSVPLMSLKLGAEEAGWKSEKSIGSLTIRVSLR